MLHRMKSLLIAAVVMAAGQAFGFPSWIGAYGSYYRHMDEMNPGRFSILMNEDYYGLNAAVGVKVNDGAWVEYAMDYAGNVDGNSYWTFTPGFQFPGSSVVQYYFHGYDDLGNNIYDTRSGLNYEFTVSPDPEPFVQHLDDGQWVIDGFGNGITYSEEIGVWIDFKIRNIGSPRAIGIVWTWNDWQDWETADAVLEEDLEGDYEQYGVDLLPAGVKYSHRSLGFIRWFPQDSTEYIEVQNKRVVLKYAIFYLVGNTWYWDNNNGEDYSVVIGEPLDPIDPDDTDGDGLPDTWEMQFIGSLDQSATDNTDGDGVLGFPMDNMIEYVTGNNPNVPNDPMGVRLLWSASYPHKNQTITLSYFPGNEGSPLFGKPVYAHVGHNGWTDVYDTMPLQLNGQTARYEIAINVPGDAEELNVVFTDKNGSWDNNNGQDWNIPVQP